MASTLRPYLTSLWHTSFVLSHFPNRTTAISLLMNFPRKKLLVQMLKDITVKKIWLCPFVRHLPKCCKWLSHNRHRGLRHSDISALCESCFKNFPASLPLEFKHIAPAVRPVKVLKV